MKQVSQSLKTGVTEIIDVPAPMVRTGCLLIRSSNTLISAGTERMLVEFGRANLLDKARKQPEKVRQVIDKVRTDGLMTTVGAVRAKLDQAIPLGYCNAGVVISVGQGVEGFRVGDRVISNGPHAEIVCVPQNLCAKIPEGVSDEQAAFCVLGAIGLQGIRLAQPTLGETFVVTGLGLIGLMVVQMLRANGCQVIGIDIDAERCALARELGAAEVIDLSAGDDAPSKVAAVTSGRGVDGVLITAATKDSGPVKLAAELCRKRGRIVLVGVAGLQLDRAVFFEKELSFQVSCSYGPGRYDPRYEEQGLDYPLAYVRWTEQRNFEAVLGLLAAATLDVAPLISHRFSIAEGAAAYELIAGGKQRYLGVLLGYPKPDDLSAEPRRVVSVSSATPSPGKVRVGVIGAGNFASLVMAPALLRSPAVLETVGSAGGFSAVGLAKKFGFAKATSDAEQIIGDPAIDAVVITTRHDTHAELTCRALRAGKHVLVEKPLAVDEQQLQQVQATVEELGQGAPRLLVGFNRRFSPLTTKLRAQLKTIMAPKAMVMTVNAGFIPKDHWVHDPKAGGGRIIGEGCHFIDLLRFIAGAPITAVQATPMTGSNDTLSFSLAFANGSTGTVHYFANGHKSYPKERLQVFCGGRILELDNFKVLRAHGWPGFRKMKLLAQDKGHQQEVASFIEAIEKGKPSPISLDELFEVTRASFEVDRQSCGGESAVAE